MTKKKKKKRHRRSQSARDDQYPIMQHRRRLRPRRPPDKVAADDGSIFDYRPGEFVCETRDTRALPFKHATDHKSKDGGGGGGGGVGGGSPFWRSPGCCCPRGAPTGPSLTRSTGTTAPRFLSGTDNNTKITTALGTR
jgi:hypothetical protein